MGDSDEYLNPWGEDDALARSMKEFEERKAKAEAEKKKKEEEQEQEQQEQARKKESGSGGGGDVGDDYVDPYGRGDELAQMMKAFEARKQQAEAQKQALAAQQAKEKEEKEEKEAQDFAAKTTEPTSRQRSDDSRRATTKARDRSSSRDRHRHRSRSRSPHRRGSRHRESSSRRRRHHDSRSRSRSRSRSPRRRRRYRSRSRSPRRRYSRDDRHRRHDDRRRDERRERHRERGRHEDRGRERRSRSREPTKHGHSGSGAGSGGDVAATDPMFNLSAPLVVDRFLEVWTANNNANTRVKELLELFDTTSFELRGLVRRERLVSGADLQNNFKMTRPWPAKPCKRLFVESNRPTDPTFALDFYRKGEGPCFSHIGYTVHPPTVDLALLYRVQNNKITQIHVAEDKEGLVLTDDVEEDDVTASAIGKQAFDVMIRPGGLGGTSINRVFNNYDNIPVIG
ncbi:hypothetical protein PTSG_03392 [Salpingoeca rosetta]|uniref:Uncharacterized protein n=1 Tax=Salpingoeca rosetta (strain ATCC 50818 / BSB-021) TaxID=946362 RepID=F2U525_SALR5|nr:uncharacterized protein PTSG_03392 [Salpingoeca rosetta]EGD82741.1 hypothetical protein PTSG_03392 [Salpingoeca rosetta]|eukprot:XP_004995977.1 hypothetical protein PTSG_03392 [Salpingoeca rosetta]